MDEPSENSTSSNIPLKPTVRQPDGWSFTAEIVKTILVVFFLAYVIRVYGIQPFIVEGTSMFPTFHDRDYLLVDKFTYRITSPQRGDIIVFKYPFDLSVNYVKRIIGLPGDHIHLENGKVTVTSPGHPKTTLSEPYVSSGNLTLPTNQGKADFDVPAGQYFVLGDNREASSDSREWGDLPQQDIIGRVLVQAYPLARFTILPHASYQIK